MEINQILTVKKARDIIKEEIKKMETSFYVEINKLRLKIIDLEAIIKSQVIK